MSGSHNQLVTSWSTSCLRHQLRTAAGHVALSRNRKRPTQDLLIPTRKSPLTPGQNTTPTSPNQVKAGPYSGGGQVPFSQLEDLRLINLTSTTAENLKKHLNYYEWARVENPLDLTDP